MSAVVTLATMPLVALYFNQISWLGLLTNLAAVPLMGGVLVPMGLLAALGHGLMGGDDLPFAAAIQWAMDGFVVALHGISHIPGAEWHLPSPSPPSLLAFYICLGATGVGSDRWLMKRLAVTGLVLLFGWWMWSPRLLLDGDRFRIMFLDVSQGDSAVLELPGGEVVLIDGGASYERFDMGRAIVAPYLWNRGIRTIDYVIATHPQLDHVGAALELTTQKARQVEAALREFPEVKYTYATVNTGFVQGKNKVNIFVQLVPRKERKRSQNDLTRPMRERLGTLSVWVEPDHRPRLRSPRCEQRSADLWPARGQRRSGRICA